MVYRNALNLINEVLVNQYALFSEGLDNGKGASLYMVTSITNQTYTHTNRTLLAVFRHYKGFFYKKRRLALRSSITYRHTSFYRE